MGLFVQRPEEPSEWAGLPGEPLRPRPRAEVLPEDGATQWRPDVIGGAPSPVTFIEIAVSVPSDSAGAVPRGSLADGDDGD